MNDLFVATAPTLDARVFDCYWMTGLAKRGRIHITVPRLDDARTAAELSALQYLLEVKNACGHNKAGSGLIIRCSSSAIPSLLKGEAGVGYLAPYANFLRTRFAGCQLVVEEYPHPWANEGCEANVDFVEIEKPSLTTVEVAGVGLAELTAHAVERYIERFQRPPAKAWRDIKSMAADVRPVTAINRGVLTDIKHRRPGRRFLNEKRGAVFVVVPPDRMDGLPRIVSVQRATEFLVPELSQEAATI